MAEFKLPIKHIFKSCTLTCECLHYLLTVFSSAAKLKLPYFNVLKYHNKF